MSKNKERDDFEDLRSHMEHVQKLRKNRKAASEPSPGSKDILEQVNIIMKPVVNAFIEGDRSLFLQSSGLASFFVSCGYSHVIRVWVTTATEENVTIMMQGDSSSHVIYSGPVQKEDIEKAVKSSLLNWYTSVFSS